MVVSSTIADDGVQTKPVRINELRARYDRASSWKRSTNVKWFQTMLSVKTTLLMVTLMMALVMVADGAPSHHNDRHMDPEYVEEPTLANIVRIARSPRPDRHCYYVKKRDTTKMVCIDINKK
ncbi:hypothetical protein AAG570_009048 [Ranatra chinensis]|uniref:Uncharacterized protein n=1 Tax=Ranatra chinensis TaxID=642074 RepID=A0ABD0Z3B0_9HEMI